jgi:hypothetical protein
VCYSVPELCDAELWKCAVDSSRRNDSPSFSERIVPSSEEGVVLLERFRHELPITTQWRVIVNMAMNLPVL